jgi:ABC-type multidrug transport system ATPase subunit
VYALRLCERLGLDLKCEIGKLSRGNKQKVLLIVAETLAAFSGPSLLFLDEPLAGMDVETREVVADLWASTNSMVLRLVVLHELESVKKADSLFTVAHGELRHTFEQSCNSWFETCRVLRAS